MRTFTLAILADTCTNTLSVLRYAHITADTYLEAMALAERIGAVVCGWRCA